MIRILVADDHAIVRSGLKQLLQLAPDFEVQAEAANGHEVMQQLETACPDVLLLDVNMPGGPEGSELLQRVLGRWPSLPVLVLSMHDEPQVAACRRARKATSPRTATCRAWWRPSAG